MHLHFTAQSFNKYLLLYTFAFDNLLVAVLTQKDEMNDECPISPMSTSMQGPELNYHAIHKQAYIV